MALWNDIVEPEDLTYIAREGYNDAEESAEFNLSRFLPNEFRQSTHITLEAGDNGFIEAAEFRSYDAETPIGGIGEGGRRLSFELPALGQKRRLSEYNQLSLLGENGYPAVKDAIERSALKRGQAVADRIELARGRVLVSGKAVINENGFRIDSDFGRDPELTVTPATAWSDGSANPLEDISDWVEAYSDKNGLEPSYMLVSNKIVRALRSYKGFLPKDSVRSQVSFKEINAFLAEEDLPQLVKYNRKVNVGRTPERVIPEDTALFLPEANAGLGNTFWGVTLESFESEYSLAVEDRPGIVVGAYKDDDPVAVWVKAFAVGMPALANANLAMAATVL